MPRHSSRWALTGLKALAPSIYVQEASRASSSTLPTHHELTSPTSASPALILLTSWTGADPRHVVKYTKWYNEVYPETPIMIITTVITDLFLRSTKEKAVALEPAVEFLRRHISTHFEQTILLHAFSEGGSHKAVCLARAYLSATGCRLPVGAFIFDSTPGKPHFSSNVAAFKRSLPANKAVRAIGVPVGTVVLGMVYGTYIGVKGFDNNLISQTRKALNDEELWEVRGAPRTYIFSEADDLIHWGDIEDHAWESAELLGLESMMVRFSNSAHCNHARDNEDDYWTAVVKTWEARDRFKVV